MKKISSMRLTQIVALLTCVSLSLLPHTASADLFLAVNNEADINNGSTWDSGVAPIAGDTNQWGTSNFKLKTVTQTWEGQELIVQTGGLFGQGSPGATLTMNGDLTLDGGKITTFNNLPFTIDLQGNTFNLNSGIIDSGVFNSDRDVRFANAVLSGNGTIAIEGGEAAVANRSDVQFQSTVDMSGFTGTFDVLFRTRFFLPQIPVEEASFGINVGGSGGISLTNDLAVTGAQFGTYVVPAGSYTQTDLLNVGVNSNRFIGAGTGVLTVVPDGGDWDFDNDVDGKDFLFWQRGAGAVSQLTDWQAQYGGAPPMAAVVGTAPEPISIVLLGMAGVAAAAIRQREKSSITLE